MKRIIIALISTLFVCATSTTMAGGNKYKHSGWNGHHKQHHSYRHHGHNSDNGAYLVGGLILGSVIANSYHQSHHQSQHSYRVVNHSTYQEPVIRRQVIYSTRVIEPQYETAITGRRLFRDLEGNCYEIHRSDEGDELKEQLPEQDCHW